ncbi:MAG: hypothetical protein U0841_22095 [Chloroflexia bacterium]
MPLVAISVPMHTATRLGVAIAERVRRINPDAHLLLQSVRAVNAEYLRPRYADSVIGGEFEAPLLDLVRRLEAGERPAEQDAAPHLARLPFVVPERAELPALRGMRGCGGAARSSAGYVGRAGLSAHLPALPDSAGVRRALLRGAAGGGAGRYPRAGGGGARHHVQRSDFLNGRGMCCGSRGRCTRSGPG